MKLSRSELVGGAGGLDFGDYVLPRGSRIASVYVHAGDYVDGLQFEYETPDGHLGLLPYLGGTGGDRHQIALDPGENLTALSGFCAEFVDALQIHTTRRSSEVFGGASGIPFHFAFGKSHEFAGIFGRAGSYLDAIGVLIQNRRRKMRLRRLEWRERDNFENQQSSLINRHSLRQDPIPESRGRGHGQDFR